MKEVKTIVTHDGPFHADDVFAVALLKYFYPKAKVIRTRDKSVMGKADIVLDVGMIYDPTLGRFDHHQTNGSGKRDNGISYSAIGLVWKEYGLAFCDNNQEIADKMNDGFVAALDANDNGQELVVRNEYGVSPTILPEIVGLYRPTTHEEQDYDAAFDQVVEWAEYILLRMKKKRLDAYTDKMEFRKMLEEAPDNRYLVMDEFIVGSDVYDDFPELLYTIFPSTNGNWTIRAVSKDKESFATRKPLPIAWGGLEGTEFIELTGVADAIFCHKDVWICAAKSKNGALQLLELALNNE